MLFAFFFITLLTFLVLEGIMVWVIEFWGKEIDWREEDGGRLWVIKSADRRR